MKKIFLFYLSLFIFITAKANEVGHFFVDLSSQNVSVANISTSFSNYVNVASGSTFSLFWFDFPPAQLANVSSRAKDRMTCFIVCMMFTVFDIF